MLGKAVDNWGDPKYWGNVLNMLLMVLVLMKVFSSEDVAKGVDFVRQVLGEL